MGKKESGTKAAAKAAKKDKQATKAAKREAAALKSGPLSMKGPGKGKGAAADEEEDLDAILERYREEMAANAQATTTTLESWPPPRTGALLLASPSTLSAEPASNHLYLLFGEYFDGSRATFYRSTLRYDIAKNEWREYVGGGEGPSPRSSAAGVGVPGLGEGGGIVIFGGEYASPTQTSFHHYKDLWVFDIKSHAWEKIDTKRGPSGRSGHRMVLWKSFILLFGGFIDTGIKTQYLSDLWVFSLDDLKWRQVEGLDPERSPGARSGFSFIPCPEGAILHGGYRKDYVKGLRPKGVPLDDTWLLRMDTDPTKIKWERRKRAGYHPSVRSGTSMAYWANKGMGVLFGGVLDEEKDEEDLESTFYNDLFAYNTAGTGRWSSLNLKKRKKAGKRRKKVEAVEESAKVLEDGSDGEDGDQEAEAHDDADEAVGEEGEDVNMGPEPSTVQTPEHDTATSRPRTNGATPADDADDATPAPLTRYNAMLAVVRNTLYIYGGIFETAQPAREYTLDDFVTLNLEKLDRWNYVRSSGLEELEWMGSDDEEGDSSDDDEGEGQESESEGEEGDEIVDEEEDDGAGADQHATMTQVEKDALRRSAALFLGISRSASRSLEDVLSTPQPGETLRAFYERARAHWAAVAYARSGARGKTLRREGFGLASARYAEYRPVLREVERIQQEAEVEAATAKRAGPGAGEGRNRR